MTKALRIIGSLLLGIALLAGGVAAGWRMALDPGEDDSDARPQKARKIESPAEQVDLLAELGYVDGTYDPHAERAGVIRNDVKRAYDGLNLYSSRKRHEAFLIDNKGKVIHKWRHPSPAWQHVELLPDGSLLVLLKDRWLMKLSAESELLWQYDARVHHDLGLDSDGNIFVLTRRPEDRSDLSERYATLVDYVTVLSPDGELLYELDLLQILRGSPYAFLLPATTHLRPRKENEDRARDLDLLHTNHVEVFDGSQESPLFAKGNLLVSMRNINTIAVLDGQTHEIVWVWGPSNVVFQHHPVLLDNGHLLVFDNGRKRSRVLELDPLTREIVWSYGPRKGFFSKTRGANQRLPNGNTLITESDTGYVFEVTKGGKKVWQFANPDVDDQSTRMAIWRMTRFDRADLPFLDEPRGQIPSGNPSTGDTMTGESP